MVIEKLSVHLVSLLGDAFATWPKSITIFENYLLEQNQGERDIWVACKDNQVMGYITLKWSSAYASFRKNNIPEINDLNVLLQFRNQGIGSELLKTAEKAAFAKSNCVGLGVGLYADYGAAQKLYIKKGYIPDGNGMTYNYEYVQPGVQVLVDDNLLLWLIKAKNES